jgi:hypothetical protein
MSGFWGNLIHNDSIWTTQPERCLDESNVWFLGKQEVKPLVLDRLFPNINTGDRLQPPNENGEDNMYRLCRCRNFIGALVFLTSMALSTSALQAQTGVELDAKVPFAFHVENAKLPAGEYFIHRIQDAIGLVLEIQSANQKISMFVMPASTETNTHTQMSDLTFDKIGNKYFLRGITMKDRIRGYEFAQSKTEERLAQNNMKTGNQLSVKHQQATIRKS